MQVVRRLERRQAVFFFHLYGLFTVAPELGLVTALLLRVTVRTVVIVLGLELVATTAATATTAWMT